MLDASTYFGLSDRDRVAYVFAHSKMPEGFSVGTAMDAVQKALEGKTPAAITGVIIRVDNEFKHAAPLPDLLDAALAAVVDLEKNEKAHAIRMEKTIQGLSSLRLQDEKTESDSTLLALNEELVRRRLEQQDEFTAKREQFAVVLAARRRRADIERELKGVQPMFDRLTDLNFRLEAVKQELALVVRPTPTEERAAREAAYAARKSEETHAAAAQRLNLELDRLRIQELELDVTEVCPYCGAAGDGWKKTKLAEITAKGEELDKAKEEEERLYRSIGQVRMASARAVQVIEETLRRHTELAAAVAGLKDEVANAERLLSRANGLSTEAASLAPDDPELETAAKMAELKLKKTVEDLGAIIARRNAVASRTAEVRRLAQAELERDQAKEAQEVAKLAAEALRTFKAEVVAKVLVPLLESANSFFPEILPTPLAYHDEEIGTWRGAVWVAHKTFSGVEKALAYAAIQAALAAQAPVRIMLMDELARIHDEFLPRFVAGVVRAIEGGKLDGFVGIDPSRKWFYEKCAAEDSIPTFQDGTRLLFRELE